MASASLLVELHTEELPPRALQSLANAFASGIAKGLRERGFTGDSVVTPFGAPRRLAVHITNVAARSADKPFKQKLMPLTVAQDKAKNWSAAFIKKLEALGRGDLAKLALGTANGSDTLSVESDGKADSVFLQGIVAGQNLIVALQSALDDTLDSLPIPKVMNYQLADGTTRNSSSNPDSYTTGRSTSAVTSSSRSSGMTASAPSLLAASFTRAATRSRRLPKEAITRPSRSSCSS